MPLKLDTDFLNAAIAGYQEQLKEINARMADLRAKLGGKPASAEAAPPSPKKRRLSRQGRARIIAATKKRWAAVRQAKAEAAAKLLAPKPAAKRTAAKSAGKTAKAAAAPKGARKPAAGNKAAGKRPGAKNAKAAKAAKAAASPKPAPPAPAAEAAASE